MREFRVYAVVFLALPLVASLFGCDDSSEEVAATSSGNANSTEMRSSAPPPPPPSAPPAAESPAPSGKAKAESTAFSTVLESWSKGDQGGAVQQLLLVRWDEPALFADVPLLNLSQDELDALPRDERTRMLKEYIKLVGTLKDLNRHCRSVAEDALASGDKQTAKAHYEAVLHLGEALSSPKRVSTMQGTGKALVRMAEEKLSALK